ncbi:MAG: aminoacyl-tRNA hydrolase [Desulfobacteraceae bacterium]|nr:MAG: aminoacyl-tRNA hydrolase [Desulfobacteraceae bacterium]
MIRITPTLSIQDREIREEFIRASGPGGQNVNKVATAVQLRFNAGRSTSLPEDVKQRLKSLAGKRMTAAGVLIIHAARFRTQEQNRRDARERLVQLIRKATQKPKARVKTKPSLKAKERRLKEKQMQSKNKNQRKSVQDFEA